MCDLIDIYSPSGKEQEILEYLLDYGQKNGIRFHRQEVDEDRYNLIYLPESNDFKDEPAFFFIGHVDTVPAYDFASYDTERMGDRIQGLGASDMKGGCAAILEAFTRHLQHHGRMPPAGICLAVGEEENNDGIKAFTEKYSAGWSIVAEPTELIPCFSHYGYLELEIDIKGKRKHASLVRRDYNAVYNMLKLLAALTNHLDVKRKNVIYNIRYLESSNTGFSTPDRCTSILDIHIPPETSLPDFQHELEHIIEANFAVIPAADRSYEFSTLDEGYSLETKGLFPQALSRIYNEFLNFWKIDYFRSHSDACYLWKAGAKPVMLGPGSLAEAHSPDEWVSFQQVVQAAEIYSKVLEALAEKIE